MERKKDVDAAFVNFEKQLDVKLDAKLQDIRSEMARSANRDESMREVTGDEIFEEMNLEISKLKKECNLNGKKIKEISARLTKLEDGYDRRKKEGNPDGEITDDLSK